MSQPSASACHRPYLVVAAFPGELPRTIARTYNKCDAEAHVRFLKRRMSIGEFYVVFDPEPSRGRQVDR